MKTYQISEVQEMAGMPLPRIEGIIEKVYPKSSGEGRYGPWTIQNALLSQGNDKIKVVFKNFADQSGRTGKKIVLRASEGKKRMTGLSVKKNVYKGNETIEIQVTPSAIVLGDGEGALEDVPRGTIDSSETSYKAPSKNTVEASSNDPKQSSAIQLHKNDKEAVEDRLHQLAGLYGECWEKSFVLAGQMGDSSKDFFKNTTQDMVKDIASCLFIQMVSEGMADKMPKFHSKPVEIKGWFPSIGEQGEGSDLEDSDIPF